MSVCGAAFVRTEPDFGALHPLLRNLVSTDNAEPDHWLAPPSRGPEAWCAELPELVRQSPWPRSQRRNEAEQSETARQISAADREIIGTFWNVIKVLNRRKCLETWWPGTESVFSTD